MKEIEEKLLQGIQAQQAGELRRAEAIYLEILAQFPEQADALHLLGTVAQALGELELAASLIESAIEQNPQVALYRHNLGVVYESLGQPENALSSYQKALQLNSKAYGSAFRAAKILVNCRRHEEAIPLLQLSLENPAEQAGIPLAEVHLYLAIAYRDQGEHSVALNHLEQALTLDPDLEQARWFYHLYLPAVYQNEQELEHFRSRFVKHLDILIRETALETQEQQKTALSASGLGTNHYLQYQGFNDIDLQKKYASFVQSIVTACYPEWSHPMTPRTRQKGDPIRVGFLSDSMRACSYSRLSLGWVKYLNTGLNKNLNNSLVNNLNISPNTHLNADQNAAQASPDELSKTFKIFAYHVNPKTDFMTDLYRQYADIFYHIPTGLEAIARQVLQDQLDILVYLEIGLSPLIMQLASLRLAPVQCSTWAHPVTSGLSTIDYFLSSDFMEPDNGQEHYSEKLIRLPHLGTCFAKPVLPEQKLYRHDFGLREDAVVYLTCQYLGKYLPRYDYLFAAIAKRVPAAQFAFLALPNRAIAEKFRQRLIKVFSAYGLSLDQHCLILPHLDYEAYLDLNRCADVMLDSFGWSGGITTLEAIACGLPVITCPGELMRGRHTYAMLKKMGLTTLITPDLSGYEDLAVQLGSNPEFRQHIATQIQQQRDLLFEDQECVAALGHFFQQVATVSTEMANLRRE